MLTNNTITQLQIQSHKDKYIHSKIHIMKQRHSDVSPLLYCNLTHLLWFCRRAKTQAEDAEQQKLEMEKLAEMLVEADKRGDVAEKGYVNVIQKRSNDLNI